MAGPGSNLTGTRMRNTLINRGSRTAVGSNPSALNVAGPDTYGGYATQVMGLQTQLAGALALQKAGIGAANAQFMVDNQAAKAARVQGVTEAEMAAQDRGVLGSSSDLTARANAEAAAAAQRQAALSNRASTVAGIRGQTIGALGQYYTGLGQAQMDKTNAEAMAAAERFRNDLYDSWNMTLKKLGPGRRRVQPGAYRPNAATGNGGGSGAAGGATTPQSGGWTWQTGGGY